MYCEIGDYRVLRHISGLNHERFFCLTPVSAGRRSHVEIAYRRHLGLVDETPHYLSRRSFCTPDIPQVLALARVDVPPRNRHAAVLSHPGGVSLADIAARGGSIPDEVLLNLVERIARAVLDTRTEVDDVRVPGMVVLLLPSVSLDQIYLGFDGTLAVPVWPLETGPVALNQFSEVGALVDVALALAAGSAGELRDKFLDWEGAPPTLPALHNDVARRARRAAMDDVEVGLWLSSILPAAFDLEQARRSDWEIGGTKGALETGSRLAMSPLGFAG